MSDFNTDPSTRPAASVRRRTICMLRGARLQRRSVRQLFRGGGRYSAPSCHRQYSFQCSSLVSDQVEMVKAPAATIADLTCLHCGHVDTYAPAFISLCPGPELEC